MPLSDSPEVTHHRVRRTRRCYAKAGRPMESSRHETDDHTCPFNSPFLILGAPSVVRWRPIGVEETDVGNRDQGVALDTPANGSTHGKLHARGTHLIRLDVHQAALLQLL